MSIERRRRWIRLRNSWLSTEWWLLCAVGVLVGVILAVLTKY